MLFTVDLLGLLKWHEVLNDVKALKNHLDHLMKEEGEEIVKVSVTCGWDFVCPFSFLVGFH